MAILSGKKILSEVEAGRIEIEPFDEGQVNPASYDVRLGDAVRVYRQVTYPGLSAQLDGSHLMSSYNTLDPKVDLPTEEYKISDRGWVVKPGNLYLMHTVERIHTTHFVPVLDGKSSIGRLGVQIHVTAGYGDPGFDGQYTLEVVCVHPVRLYAGMRIGQMRFHEMSGELLDYRERGHYTGRDAAMGAVPSYAHKQFEEDHG